MPDLHLNGCRAEPLASYLKGLGVFRLLAEQRDPDARAHWEGDHLILRTCCDREELLEFFLGEYQPTPIVSPWSGGSGFAPGDPVEGLNTVAGSDSPRFMQYRNVIQQVRSWPEFSLPVVTTRYALDQLDAMISELREGKAREDLQTLRSSLSQARESLRTQTPAFDLETANLNEIKRAKKESPEQKEALTNIEKLLKKARTKIQSAARSAGKTELMERSRSRLPDAALAWLDAAYVLRPSKGPSYNPILGTGGNEGRLDFSNNFMQHLAVLLLPETPSTRPLLGASLFGDLVEGLEKISIGQFDPGRAGGFNQGAEVETKDFKANRWDFVLAMEGTLLLGAAVSRRTGSGMKGPWASIPFTVRSTPVGFSSAEEGDNARAETWLPLWSRPAGLPELKQLLAEGRGSVGRRAAENSLDFARAAATLGVDRGIESFQRFAFLERRGKSYVALPAGRLPVRQEPKLSILNELDPILAKLDRWIRASQNPPHTLASERRNLDAALFDLCRNADAPAFQKVLQTLGRLEKWLARRSHSGEGAGPAPLSGLSVRWIREAGDSTEVRLAASLASIHGEGGVGPLRSNLSGVDPHKPWLWGSGHGQQCWRGSDLSLRLSGVLARRMMDGEKLGARELPLRSHLKVHSADTLPFLYGRTDDRCLEDLLWAFTLIDWNRQNLSGLRDTWRTPLGKTPHPRDYCLLKLLFMPGNTRGVSLKTEPRIPGLLAAGRTLEACQIAVSRLRSSGLPPRSTDFGDGQNVSPARLAAALLIPVLNRKTLEDAVLVREDLKTRM